MIEEQLTTIECPACKGTGKISGQTCPACDGLGYSQQSSMSPACPQCGYDGHGEEALLTASVEAFDSTVPMPLACQKCTWVNPTELIDGNKTIVWNDTIGRRWLRNPDMKLGWN